MQEAKKARLRAKWHGPLTAAQIAREAAVGEAWLKKFWLGEKHAGRLPDGPRPHFVERTQRAPEPVEDVIDDGDATPIGEPNRVCVAECEALLAALRHLRPADTAATHEAPLDWLRFDRKGMPTPTHAMLMRMCRERDAIGTLARLARVPGVGVPA